MLGVSEGRDKAEADVVQGAVDYEKRKFGGAVGDPGGK